jgi:hypothetical protein
MEAKCEVCDKEAEFDSPADLCDYHWKLWWYSGMFGDTEPWELPRDMSPEECEFYLKIKRDGEFLKIETTDNGKLIIFDNKRIHN